MGLGKGQTEEKFVMLYPEKTKSQQGMRSNSIQSPEWGKVRAGEDLCPREPQGPLGGPEDWQAEPLEG